MNKIKELYLKQGIQLKTYQQEGIEWMLTLESNNKSGLLADDPGLGKSFQALALIMNCSHRRPTLLVVPTTILNQWKDICIQFFPQTKVLIHHGSKRTNIIPSGIKIVITTPGTLLNSPILLEKHWRRIIIDEIHIIKNPKSKIAKMVCELRGKFRWGLTGTPVQNNRSDIVSIFKFVTNHFQQNIPEPLSIEYLINHHFLRRKKTDYLSLPDIKIENLQLDFHTQEEKDFYHMIKKNVRQDMEALADRHLHPREEMSRLFVLLLRLRQAATHPQLCVEGYRKRSLKTGSSLLIPDWDEQLTTTKHHHLMNLIETHPEDRTIVFCQFTQEIDMLVRLSHQKNLNSKRIDGSVPLKQRNLNIQQCQGVAECPPIKSPNGLYLPLHIRKLIDTFLKIDIVFIQIKAGSVGLNLQNFNRIYFTTPDWNPANEDQAIARAWRYGQKKKVVVNRLLLHDKDDLTSIIDNRIIAIQTEKRKIYAKILQDDTLEYNGDFSKTPITLTRNDFKSLLI